MGIDPEQLKRLTSDVLYDIGKRSNEAVDLLMLTSAQESKMGYHLYQLENGPARGIFQIEPATHKCLHENFLNYPKNEALRKQVGLYSSWSNAEFDLVGNVPYQIVVCRLQYFRFPERLPWRDDFNDDFNYVLALAKYWKKYWNTSKGKGTVGEAVRNYYKYVLNTKLV
jgi:hypothetical protein